MPSIEELEGDLNLLGAESSLESIKNEINTNIHKLKVILEFLKTEEYEEFQELMNSTNMLSMSVCIIEQHNGFSSLLHYDYDFQELCLEYIEELSMLDNINTNIIDYIVLEVSLVFEYRKIFLDRILNIYNNGVRSVLALLPEFDRRMDAELYTYMMNALTIYDILEFQHIVNNSVENLSITNIVALQDGIQLNSDFFTKFFDV